MRIGFGKNTATYPTLPPIPTASSYYNKGYDYYNDGKYQLAINEFTTAIRLNPNYTDAYKGRGLAYYTLRQYQLALQDYDKAIQLDPDYADAYKAVAKLTTCWPA